VIVYAVFEYNYDESCLHFIHSTKEKAQDWINNYCKITYDKKPCNFEILEKEVQ
jgi:hypothetical protein